MFLIFYLGSQDLIALALIPSNRFLKIFYLVFPVALDERVDMQQVTPLLPEIEKLPFVFFVGYFPSSRCLKFSLYFIITVPICLV